MQSRGSSTSSARPVTAWIVIPGRMPRAPPPRIRCAAGANEAASANALSRSAASRAWARHTAAYRRTKAPWERAVTGPVASRFLKPTDDREARAEPQPSGILTRPHRVGGSSSSTQRSPHLSDANASSTVTRARAMAHLPPSDRASDEGDCAESDASCLPRERSSSMKVGSLTPRARASAAGSSDCRCRQHASPGDGSPATQLHQAACASGVSHREPTHPGGPGDRRPGEQASREIVDARPAVSTIPTVGPTARAACIGQWSSKRARRRRWAVGLHAARRPGQRPRSPNGMAPTPTRIKVPRWTEADRTLVSAPCRQGDRTARPARRTSGAVRRQAATAATPAR